MLTKGFPMNMFMFEHNWEIEKQKQDLKSNNVIPDVVTNVTYKANHSNGYHKNQDLREAKHL